jgi:hypothetical protein
MIYDTLNEGQGDMEYIAEILETYAKTMAVMDKKLDKAMTQALQFDDLIS